MEENQSEIIRDFILKKYKFKKERNLYYFEDFVSTHIAMIKCHFEAVPYIAEKFDIDIIIGCERKRLVFTSKQDRDSVYDAFLSIMEQI